MNTASNLQLCIKKSQLSFYIYNFQGGMKAVVWTDTLQALIMLAGCLAVFIKSTMEVGGFAETWSALERGGRLNMFK